jgi:single-strand DNA-binding protein
MNQCHFMGNLTRDPELKQLANNKRVVNFGLAVSRRFKRGTQTAKEVSFLDCVAWDTGADLIAKHLKKGDKIIVHCSVQTDEWDDKKTGERRTKLKFRVNSFDFVGGNKTERPQDEDPGTAVAATVAEDGGQDDGAEIPF